MKLGYTILTNPHIMNNIIFKHKGLQSPTAKIMNDFFKKYDDEALNIATANILQSKSWLEYGAYSFTHTPKHYSQVIKIL